MKKVLLSIGTLLIASIFIVSFVNAGRSTDNPKKPATEVSKNSQKGSCCQTECKKADGNKTTECNKGKSSGANCKTVDGKCSHEACKGEGECTKKEGATCCNKASAGECKKHSGTEK